MAEPGSFERYFHERADLAERLYSEGLGKRPADDFEPNATSLAKLQRSWENMKQAKPASVSLGVSRKGGVSLHGLGRSPITLYKEQWAKLLDMADEIRDFILEKMPKLKTKGD